MKKADFDERMNILNVIYAEQAQSRPWVRFLDSRAVLSTDGGGYQAYLPGGSGEDELARNPDGIHLTRFGGDRLSAATLDLLDDAVAEGMGGTPASDPEEGTSTPTDPGN
jgi:hypothetical protein